MSLFADLGSTQKRALGVLAILGVFGMGVVGEMSLRQRPEMRLTSGTAAPVSSSNGKITVDVIGAVAKPGVYDFEPGARVRDALLAAGGTLPNAVTDVLNRAAPLEDGTQIVVESGVAVEPGAASAPKASGASPARSAAPSRSSSSAYRGSSRPPAMQGLMGPITVKPLPAYGSGTSEAYQGKSAPTERKAKGKPSGMVSLNTAGQAELETLPGVGPATARKILDYRKAHGGFGSVEELLAVSGIGEKKLAQIRPFAKL